MARITKKKDEEGNDVAVAMAVNVEGETVHVKATTPAEALKLAKEKADSGADKIAQMIKEQRAEEIEEKKKEAKERETKDIKK